MGVDGYAIGRAYMQFAVMMFIAGGALVGVSIWLLPKLWRWLKPLIHQVTA